MSREIKFRAWDVKNKKMIYHQSGTFGLQIVISSEGIVCNDKGKGSFKGIVMQFTGLHDKTGKSIYEGDIVNRWAHLDCGEIYLGVIEWKDCGLQFNPLTGYNLSDAMDGKFEVVGNIYENPELLKSES